MSQKQFGKTDVVVFFGSFDPPTNGHLHMISEALFWGASKVVMIPAWRNPWKPDQTPYHFRLAMCRMLQELYGFGKLEVSDMERTIAYSRGGLDSVPTWMVLEELGDTYPEFKILTTNETYPEIRGWEKGKEILKNYEFLILSSSHFGEEEVPGEEEIPDLPISSSMVRERLKRGMYCPEYIPTTILEYITRNRLYD